jgi:hypothetical protein
MMVLRHRPRTKKQLQLILEKRSVFEDRIRALSLGKASGQSKRSRAGQSGVMKYAVSKARGCRAAGGGRDDHFQEYKESLKEWAAKERQHGHAINAGDLWREYKFLLQTGANRLGRQMGEKEEGALEHSQLKARMGGDFEEDSGQRGQLYVHEVHSRTAGKVLWPAVAEASEACQFEPS